MDTNYFRPSTVPVEPGTILFFGAINYYPNTEGLLFFLNEVFPSNQEGAARSAYINRLDNSPRRKS